MNPVRNKLKSSRAIFSLLLLITLGGCFRSGIHVVPVPNQHVLTLNANEIVEILRAAGFSDSQIEEYGWAVREGLAKSGAVRILINNKVEAGFAIRGEEVYISTRSRGYFIYNINTGWANMPGR